MPAILHKDEASDMSSDKESTKMEDTEGEEQEEKKDVKEEKKAKMDEIDKSKLPLKKKVTAKVKEVKKRAKKEKTDESEEDDAETEKDSKLQVPLLDQPLEISGSRVRKGVERFIGTFDIPKKTTTLEVPDGKGTCLADIPNVSYSLQRARTNDLKLLHRLLFGIRGKAALVKSNIKKFCGFAFEKDSEGFENKKKLLSKHTFNEVKYLCNILDVSKKGVRGEVVERVVEFLLEPKPSERSERTELKRPKRDSAAKADDRGYADSTDSEDGRVQKSRSKSKSTKRKTASKTGDDDTKKTKRKKPSARTSKSKDDKEDDESEKESADEDDKDNKNDHTEENEDDDADIEDDADDEETEQKKKSKKAPAKKAPPKKKTAPPPKKKPEKKTNQKKKKSEGESGDEGSSEDEPLSKKPKSPPTDDEIKAYVKQVLEGANLEEITMKTVCKQVYAHYPDFDLAHKKDFIKSTVKSLIST